MPLESGTTVEIRLIEETTQGETPGDTSTMAVLRTTGRNINLEKNTLESNEVRSDRQYSDVRHGFNQVRGTLGAPLTVQGADTILEGMLGDDWTLPTISGGPDFTAAASGSTITRSAGSFHTDEFHAGMLITTTGFTNSENNNTAMRILSVNTAGTQITVDATLVDEGPVSATMVAAGPILKSSTELKTYTIERALNTTSLYQPFRGCAFNGFNLSLQPEQPAEISAPVIGMSAGTVTGTPIQASPVAAPTNEMLAPFDGTIFEGGTSIAVVTGLDLSLENQRSLVPVIGSRFSPGVFEGRANFGGTMTVLFENATLFNKFVNETGSSVFLKLDDNNGTDWLNIILPNVKYNGGSMDPPQEGPVPMQMPFRALLDGDSGTSFIIQRSNAIV